MNITVIGCGHGGQALAAHLAMTGNRVSVYADPQHPGYIDQINNRVITVEGKIAGSGEVHLLTKDIKAAIKNAEIIYITLPTNAHIIQFKKIAPYLVDGQIVINLPGNFSSIYYYHILKDLGKEKEIYLADIASLPYACRTIVAGKVEIIDVKKSMDIAAMPSKNTDYIIDKISKHFPTLLSKRINIIELGLNITSALSHPAIMIMNAGRIGKNLEEFYFYKEGISKEISNVVERLDIDRQRIGSEYGFELPSYLDLMETFYSMRYKSYYDFFTQSPVHNKMKLCPASLNERYLSQDVPYVISPWYGLGLLAGYESSVMRSIIELSSILNKVNYYTQRNVADDCFSGMSKPTITQFLRSGYA